MSTTLRIAILEDSSLVARLIVPLCRCVSELPRPIRAVAAPKDLGAHQCLTYANRSKRDVWRFTNAAGEECPDTPTGPLRGTSVEALLHAKFPEAGTIQVERAIHNRPPEKLGQIGLTAKSVVAVGSGKGGVGKSTIAASICYGLQRAGAQCGLIILHRR